MYLCFEYLIQQKYEECINFINKTAFATSQEAIDALFMPSLFSCLGECYYRLRKMKEAERNFRLGIASFPEYRENYLQLIILLMEQNRVTEARDVLVDMFSKTKRFYS
jgi:tetratricopeptide (TPR) repeat protein